MSGSGQASIRVRVTQYNTVRMRAAQLLVPAAVIFTVAVRRWPSMLSAAASFAVLTLGVGVFVSASRQLGWQPLRRDRGGLSFGATGVRMERPQLRQWTIAGGVARLYLREFSLKLKVRRGAERALGELLQEQFGAPIPIAQRGSRRARTFALAVAAVGLLLASMAIDSQDATLAMVGVPTLVLGIVGFALLSQHVARR